MRLSNLTALSLILLAVPATAQAGDRPVFGTYTCSQKVSCDNYGSSSEELARAGAACLSLGFGFSGKGEIFDTTAGLDSSNCLTTNMDALTRGQALIVPHCCVAKIQDNNCVFSCKLVQE
ncbi:MAG: hypothetical protein WC521_09135 [Bdellovibrionales bacterium]